MVVGSGELLVSGSIMHSEPMTMLAIAKMMNGMDWFTILPWKNNSNEGKWLKKKNPKKNSSEMCCKVRISCLITIPARDGARIPPTLSMVEQSPTTAFLVEVGNSSMVYEKLTAKTQVMKNLPISEKTIRITGGSNSTKLGDCSKNNEKLIDCWLPSGTNPVTRLAIPPKIKPPQRVLRWPNFFME